MLEIHYTAEKDTHTHTPRIHSLYREIPEIFSLPHHHNKPIFWWWWRDSKSSMHENTRKLTNSKICVMIASRRLCRSRGLDFGSKIQRWFCATTDASGTSSSSSTKRVTGVVKSWGLKSGRIESADGVDVVDVSKTYRGESSSQVQVVVWGSTVEFEVEKMKDSEDLMATQITMLGGESVPRYRYYNARGHFGLRPTWKNSEDGEPKNMQKQRQFGQVMSVKNNKTAMVKVVIDVKPHEKYGKYLVRRKTYACHDPQSKCRFGDMVEIETLEKNASKTKSFRVVDVIREESYLIVINRVVFSLGEDTGERYSNGG